jgi:asparagine synthetase B (glutamine-hydrolysing)
VPISTTLENALRTPIVAQQTVPCDINRLDAILREAHSDCVRVALEDGDRANVCLSGGLDSTLSLYIIQSLRPDLFAPPCAVSAYTVARSKEHQDYKHARIAALVSRMCPRNSHKVLFVDELLRERARKRYAQAFDRNPSNGEIAVFALYSFMATQGVRCVIAHDGIDELMGGYWCHIEHDRKPELKKAAFEDQWARLRENHLVPLMRVADHFKIRVLFPYLHQTVVEEITRLALNERSTRACRKQPLRELAARYGVPRAIIDRAKVGFCDVLKED